MNIYEEMKANKIDELVFMRCFIEIDIPESIKEYLFEKAEIIKRGIADTGYDMRIAKKENIHATLAFLGDVGEKDIEGIIKAASNVSKEFEAFECSISKIEEVPKKYPRMIWVSLNENKAILELYNKLKRALMLKDENRSFEAHITLARLKARKFEKKQPEKIRDAISQIGTEPLKFDARELKIMQSILKKEGPEYLLIRSIPLNEN